MVINTYNWSVKDKLLYTVSMIPFVVLFIGTICILASYSTYLAGILIILYVILNVFQAGCCVGCPYRGKYCPALGGVYLGNLFSSILYKNHKFDQKFFDFNAKIAESMAIIVLVYPLYWIFLTAWYFVLIYIVLIALHLILFMPTQCEKCSYNTTCPGGKTWLKCSRSPKITDSKNHN